MTDDDATFLENQVNPPTPHPYSNMGGWGKGCSTEKTNNKNMLNIEDELFSDNQTDYSFSELIEELERTGEILRQWENGEPDGIEPKTETETKTKENEKERRTV